MADGIVYSVVTRWKNDGLAQAGQEAERAHGSFHRLGGAAEHAESMMARLNQTAIGYLGFRAIYEDARRAAESFIEVSNAAEQAKFTISALLQAGKVEGTDTWVGAMQKGSEFIAQMRQDAQVLPGTFKDLMAIVQPTMLPGLEAGLFVRQIEKLSADMMAVGKLMQINPVVVGHEMEMLLHGRATARTPLFAKLSGAIGMTAKDFNALDSDQRIAKLNEAVSRFGPAIEAYGQTWDAISSTAEDNIDEIHRGLGAAFFSDLKKRLEEVNVYYQEHRQSILAIADAVGHKLVDAFSQLAGYIKSGLGWVIDHKDTLFKLAEVYGATIIGKNIAGFVGGGGSIAGPGGAGALVAQQMLAGTLRETMVTGLAHALGTPGNMLGNAGALHIGNETARLEQERYAGLRGLRSAFGNNDGAFSSREGFFAGGRAGLRSIGQSELQAIGNYGLPSAGQVVGSVATSVIMARLMNDFSQMDRVSRAANDAIAGTTSALGTLPGPIGQVAAGLGGLYQALNAFAGWLDGFMASSNKALVDRDAWERSAGKAQAGVYQMEGQAAVMAQMISQGVLQGPEIEALHTWAGQVVSMNADLAARVRAAGGFGPNGAVNVDAIQASMAGAGVGDAAKVQDVARMAQVYSFARGILDKDAAIREADEARKKKKDAPHHPPSVVNIYQNNNIYEADDPDRIRVVVRESLEDALYRPTHGALSQANAGRY